MQTEIYLNIMVKPVIWPNILFITTKISRQVNLLRRQPSSIWNYCDSSVLKNTSESQTQEANLETVVIKMVLWYISWFFWTFKISFGKGLRTNIHHNNVHMLHKTHNCSGMLVNYGQNQKFSKVQNIGLKSRVLRTGPGRV